MFGGQLGEINVTSHPIERIIETRAFKYAPYSAGPKNRELEKSEINKQIPTVVIDPTYYAWVAPVLFVPKILYRLPQAKLHHDEGRIYHTQNGRMNWIALSIKSLLNNGRLFWLLANTGQTGRPT